MQAAISTPRRRKKNDTKSMKVFNALIPTPGHGFPAHSHRLYFNAKHTKVQKPATAYKYCRKQLYNATNFSVWHEGMGYGVWSGQRGGIVWWSTDKKYENVSVHA